MQEAGRQLPDMSAGRRGGLGPKQQAWCDTHLPNLRRPRQHVEQAQPLLPSDEQLQRAVP